MKIYKFYFLLFLPLFLSAQSAVSLSDTTIQFGNVAAYEEHSQSVTISNNLSVAVQITSVVFEEEVFNTDLTATEIPANSDLGFNVFFNSNQNLDYTDFLRIDIDDGTYSVIAEISAACEYSDYYSATQNLWGSSLKTALYNIINGHEVQSYTPGVWNAFATTDIYTGNTIWDMYAFRADNTADYYYTLGTDQCGNYNSEADCYNREHSFPKSWFGGEVSPMFTDLFHIFATDGWVNNKRGNFPFGEVGSVSWTSTNGSKVGTCSYPGYTGTVFEPIDVFKGDFARGHLYMATRYENLIDGWENYSTESDAVLNGTEAQVFELWTLQMLLDWHTADPVSLKEINRNTAVFAIQENRNPYVDHPEFAGRIWNDSGIITYITHPEIAVAPASVNMGDIGLQQTKNFKIALINTGDATLNISSIISTNGNFTPGFSSTSIPAESYTYLTLSFTSTNTEGEFTTTLQITSNDGDESYLEIPVSINVDASVSITDNENVFKNFTLNEIYPNPFNPVTNIKFSLQHNLLVSADLYNLQGQKIKNLFQKQFKAGEYNVPINLAKHSSGIYILKLNAGQYNFVRKLVLLK